MTINMQIMMRYAVRSTNYDDNGQVKTRDQELFRLRRDAEKYAKNLREDHNTKNILSFIEVIKLEGSVVVQNFKTKSLRRREKRKR